MSEQSDDMVYLEVGPDYEGGELMRRSQLPTDAFQAAYTLNGSDLDGGEPGRTYTVFLVER